MSRPPGPDVPEGAADPAVPHAQRLLGALFGPPAGRAFDVRYWDGTEEHAGGTPRYTLLVNRAGALRRMLLPPSEIAIVEAFLSGDIDVDGDLEAASTLGDGINAGVRSLRTLAAVVKHALALPARGDDARSVRRARAARTVGRAGRLHEPARDRVAVRYHYDVGNDFYALWLDERMVYSCAYFRAPSDTLDDAQAAKLDLVCRKLRLRPGDRLLDVGCGWGGLVIHAARHYGVTALGITLSDAQATLARARIHAAGLGDRCQVEIRDYRDLPAGQAFDKIASVGMVEHVGDENLPVYFAALYRALAPGGLLLNHGIVSVNRARPQRWTDRVESRLWRREAFIDQYVFPDGKLGTLGAVIGAAEAAGFETRDVESLREHYAMTLRLWRARLTSNAERAIAVVGERAYRTWQLYMAGSAHAFASGAINLVQTLLSRHDAAGRSLLPLTRDDLVPERE